MKEKIRLVQERFGKSDDRLRNQGKMESSCESISGRGADLAETEPYAGYEHFWLNWYYVFQLQECYYFRELFYKKN